MLLAIVVEVDFIAVKKSGDKSIEIGRMLLESAVDDLATTSQPTVKLHKIFQINFYT